jgi:murein DD-endopeptidase MepM/ murein hydrolase activator NlpD
VVRPPVVIPQSTDESKTTGGVGWPLDPDATALAGGWTWEILDDGTGRTDGPRFPRAYVDPEKKSDLAGIRDGGAGALHGGATHDDGPPPGPPQGVVLDIHDLRLRLTAERALQERALMWPVKRRGYLTQPFHYMTSDWEADHLAIDVGAPLGTPLVAAADGRVMFRGWRDDRSGNAVWLKHGPDVFTAYAHMLSVSVELGQFVRRGEVIGRLGSTGNSTGPHVHFSVSVGGDRPDIAAYRVDPMPFLAPR